MTIEELNSYLQKESSEKINNQLKKFFPNSLYSMILYYTINMIRLSLKASH